MRQIFLNLLQNAIKFTYTGQITVSLQYDRVTKYLKGRVNDTGVGISEEDQKKLFQMFGKLRSTASINTNGIGLGLFICKRIAETFQGAITLEHSKLGEGTTFAFTILTKGLPGNIRSDRRDNLAGEEVSSQEGSLEFNQSNFTNDEYFTL